MTTTMMKTKYFSAFATTMILSIRYSEFGRVAVDVQYGQNYSILHQRIARRDILAKVVAEPRGSEY